MLALVSACSACSAEVLRCRLEGGGRVELDLEPVRPAVPGVRGLYVLRDVTSPEGPLALPASGALLRLGTCRTAHAATCGGSRG